MENSIISINNLSKIYKLYDRPIDRLKESLSIIKKIYHKEHYALKNISFDIKKGETVGIVGTNGSGKSTLLKIITGVLNATSGEISINGKISALLELGAGFNMEYTGIENIYLNGTILGYTREEIGKKVQAIIDFAEIGQFINQPVKTYSSGMFVRLAFAVAINVDPDILIVDEALSVGDNIFQAKCYRKFEELKEKGTTILLVTHDVDSVRKFCDRCIWLNRGEIKEKGDVQEIISEYVAFTNSKSKKDTQIQSKGKIIDEELVKVKEFNPISRWGSNVGLIKNVTLYNDKSEEVISISTREKLTLVIDIEISKEVLNNKNIGLAFSVKNTKGQDLFVGDTFGKKSIIRDDGIYRVTFYMENYLVQGEYYIVASLEKRENVIPSYFDYIDGAHYFKVVTNTTLYGMLSIPIDTNIERLI